MKKQYDLIGGQSHGQTSERSDTDMSFESPVYADDEHLRQSSHTENYTKRHFAGEEFGEGYDCFGISTDDDTETQELARMELK